MKLKPYQKYKDSGVEWLGEVPEHWNLLPCRGFVVERTSKNFDGGNENYLSLMANIGIIPYDEKGDVGNKKPEDLTKCKLVYKGDFVINSMNYGIGSYGLSPYDGVCSPVYIVLTPKNEVVETRFATRVFENKAFQAHAQSFGNGILEHRAAINWDILKGISVGIPPIEEQSMVLNFIDRETAKLDTLIAKQEKLIELLKEKRQAIISHAVTKGLDPNVKMKDSAVEWLGMVPLHWEISNLRFLGNCQNGINIGAEYFGSGYPFLSYGDVYKNDEIPEKASGLVQSTENDRVIYSVLKGDVFFTRTSETIDEIGFTSVCFNSIENATFAGFLIRFRPTTNKLNINFSKYYFRNILLRAFFVKEMNLVTRASLSQDLLKKLPVTLPPTEEQLQIAKFLDKKCRTFDELTRKAKKAIDLMKEHRTALISAAITGKIDVREYS